jgi:hypothetical protein
MQAGSDRYVSLRGGLTIPLEPLLLALDLEARGFRLMPDGDSIVVAPFSQLTEDDQRQLRRWKLHVLALLEYRAPEVLQ